MPTQTNSVRYPRLSRLFFRTILSSNKKIKHSIIILLQITISLYIFFKMYILQCIIIVSLYLIYITRSCIYTNYLKHQFSPFISLCCVSCCLLPVYYFIMQHLDQLAVNGHLSQLFLHLFQNFNSEHLPLFLIHVQFLILVPI